MTRIPARFTGFLYLIAAILLWSTAEVVVRTIVYRITPIQLSFVRFAGGVVFLGLFLPAELRRRNLRITRVIIAHGAWMAGIGIVVATLAFHYSLQYAGAGIVATIYGTTPLMVFVMARVILGEPMTMPKFVGLIVGFIGIMVLALSKESGVFSVLGFSLAILCNACFAFFTVVSKRFAGPFTGLPIVVICMAWSVLFMAPLVVIEGEWAMLRDIPELIWPLLYISIGTTGIAYLLYFIGLARVEATQAASMIFIKPPVATVLAAIVLHEPVTWNLAVAMALILAALYLVIALNRRRLGERRATPAI